MDLCAVAWAGGPNERQGARAVAAQPSHHHVRARGPDRPARGIRDRGWARHLGLRDQPGTDRRAALGLQADLHDGRARSTAVHTPVGAGALAGSATGNRRVAVPRVVRGAGIQPRLAGTGRLAFPPHGAADCARSRQVRQEARSGHAIRPCLLPGTRGRHRLAPVRATGRTIQCRRQLRLDERGTSGDLAEQIVRCECGKSRRMHEATDVAKFPLSAPAAAPDRGWDATPARSASFPAGC